MKKLLISIIITSMVIFPTSAFSQMACQVRNDIVSKLKEKYGEKQLGSGISGQTGVIEVWSSEKTGTWTITLTRTNGITCVLAAGDSWNTNPIGIKTKSH